MDVLVKIFIIAASAFVMFWMAWELHLRFGLFEYRKNPYRRYCRKCGQLQEQYCFTFSNSGSWWEDMGEIMDADCVCHKHSEYHA